MGHPACGTSRANSGGARRARSPPLDPSSYRIIMNERELRKKAGAVRGSPGGSPRVPTAGEDPAGQGHVSRTQLRGMPTRHLARVPQEGHARDRRLLRRLSNDRSKPSDGRCADTTTRLVELRERVQEDRTAKLAAAEQIVAEVVAVARFAKCDGETFPHPEGRVTVISLPNMSPTAKNPGDRWHDLRRDRSARPFP